MQYDVIGDIHGHADALIALLTKMDYTERNGAWRHPERRAIFLGDYIDRGPRQHEVVSIVRRMVDADTAKAIMGNHELNAIAWYLHHPTISRRHLRTHTGLRGKKNRHQHQAFIGAVKGRAGMHGDLIKWFLSLPMWLDLPEVRVVHACWHPTFMQQLRPFLSEGNRLSEDLMILASREPKYEPLKDNPDFSIFKAVEALTKGIEVPIPKEYAFTDEDGHTRNRVRTAWWNRKATTLGEAAHISPKPSGKWRELALPPHASIDYPTDKPLFFGHYWLKGEPDLPADVGCVACLDYSVAKKGKLVAYRTDGELKLSHKGFVSV
jgi:hypothetical protein